MQKNKKTKHQGQSMIKFKGLRPTRRPKIYKIIYNYKFVKLYKIIFLSKIYNIIKLYKINKLYRIIVLFDTTRHDTTRRDDGMIETRRRKIQNSKIGRSPRPNFEF